MDDLDKAEEYYRRLLARMEAEHQKAIKPIVDRLVEIASLRPPKPILLKDGNF